MQLLSLVLAAQIQVPLPARVVPFGQGSQPARTSYEVVVPSLDQSYVPATNLLTEALLELGIRVSVRYGRPRRGGPPAIALEIARDIHPDSEAYDIRSAPSGIRLRGATGTGLIWSVQTFRQLFKDGPSPRQPRTLFSGEIQDAPRFPWRGVLLDAGRHFFPIAAVKRQLDLMSRYKLNVLHWHLTEDQGWRIDIRAYPRLVQVGGWRVESDGSRYGGYYTQDDVREVVEYARRRGITVVPEIEMPGHSSAAIAAYPWLGCTGDSIAVPTTWGVFSDVYCPNERTFAFLETVLSEVMALFPSRYIHLGGDEVPKDRWRACDSCQALMRREGLRDENALQTFFLARIGRFLAASGRTMIGWDEILEGGLPPGAAVQVWRDTAATRAAIRAGARAVVSPTSHAYLDYSPATISLAQVFSLDPAAGLDSADARMVLGGEGNLWSEYIMPTDVDLLAWPRLLGLAEALWSPPGGRFELFRTRLGGYERLRAAGVRVGPEDQDLVVMRVGFDSASGGATVTSRRGVSDIVIRYSTDGREPTAASPSLPETMSFSGGRVIMRAFVGDAPMVHRREVNFAEHLARGAAIATTTPPSRNYPGTGSRTLTDGLLGSTDHHDGLWQGWQGRNVVQTIDLGSVRDVASVQGSFLESAESWILLPTGLDVEMSDDGVRWVTAGSLLARYQGTRRPASRQSLTMTLPPGLRARYIRVTFTNAGPLPAWHQAAGRPSWVFADEIIVR